MLRPPCSLVPPGGWGAPKTPQTPREKGARDGNQPWREGEGGQELAQGWSHPGNGNGRGSGISCAPPQRILWPGGSKSVCVPPNPPSDPRAGLGSSQGVGRRGGSQTPPRGSSAPPSPPKAPQRWGGGAFFMPFSPNTAHFPLAGGGTPMQPPRPPPSPPPQQSSTGPKPGPAALFVPPQKNPRPLSLPPPTRGCSIAHATSPSRIHLRRPGRDLGKFRGLWEVGKAPGARGSDGGRKGKGEEKIKARRKGRRGGVRLYHFDAKVSALRSPGPPPLAWGLCSP